MSVNKTILVGRLGKDPECRYGKDGGAICSFSLATSEKWKDKSGEKQEKTSWHRIVIFGKLGEVAGQYLNKGSQVYIEGRLEYGEYEKEGVKIPTTQIVVAHMTMLGQAGGGSGGARSSGGSGQFDEGAGSGGPDDFEDDDLSF